MTSTFELLSKSIIDKTRLPIDLIVLILECLGIEHFDEWQVSCLIPNVISRWSSHHIKKQTVCLSALHHQYEALWNDNMELCLVFFPLFKKDCFRILLESKGKSHVKFNFSFTSLKKNIHFCISSYGSSIKQHLEKISTHRYQMDLQWIHPENDSTHYNCMPGGNFVARGTLEENEFIIDQIMINIIPEIINDCLIYLMRLFMAKGESNDVANRIENLIRDYLF